jgi:hypothetical protein
MFQGARQNPQVACLSPLVEDAEMADEVLADLSGILFGEQSLGPWPEDLAGSTSQPRGSCVLALPTPFAEK